MSKPLVCTLPGHTGPEGVCTCCLGCIALRAERDEARENAALYAKDTERVMAQRDALRAELAEAVGLLREVRQTILHKDGHIMSAAFHAGGDPKGDPDGWMLCQNAANVRGEYLRRIDAYLAKRLSPAPAPEPFEEWHRRECPWMRHHAPDELCSDTGMEDRWLSGGCIAQKDSRFAGHTCREVYESAHPAPGKEGAK